MEHLHLGHGLVVGEGVVRGMRCGQLEIQLSGRLFVLAMLSIHHLRDYIVWFEGEA